MNFNALIVVAALGGIGGLVQAIDNGLGKTPILGWSSWNVAQCDAASEKYALETANLFIELGLKDLNYTYVNIDDCWSTKERDSEGNLVPDPDKWPRGIRAVAEELHGMGLKLGLYGCAGTQTCGGFPASYEHEQQDAQQLADWDVDFWKYDNCYTPCLDNPWPQTCGRPAGNTQEWYAVMRDAIVEVKEQKNIMFNLCQWGRDEVWAWGNDYGNSWRMSVDNWGDWESVVRIGSAAAGISEYAGPGGFNDLDMLWVGNNKLSESEERLHFGLWAICKSPLVVGADLSKISDTSLAIISNKGIIDINQDPLGKAATTFQPPGAPEPAQDQIYPYWAGPLSDGVVIGLTGANGAATLSVNFADVPGLGGEGSYRWQEMYSGEEGSGTEISFDVGEHDMAVLQAVLVKANKFIVGANLWHNNGGGIKGISDYAISNDDMACAMEIAGLDELDDYDLNIELVRAAADISQSRRGYKPEADLDYT
ncbi:hypothetical protein FQN52_004367 [Onygenales sp. PD_12]|nr:hypothetical protein FQN52_004367 [Onygenales sp. PD_12]